MKTNKKKVLLVCNDDMFVKGIFFIDQVNTDYEATDFSFLFGIRSITKIIAKTKYKSPVRFIDYINLSGKMDAIM